MKYFRKAGGSGATARWYSLHLQTTIFGGVDVVCRWGSLSSSRKGERIETFLSQTEAQRRLTHLGRSQTSRGFDELSQLRLAA